LFGATIGFAIVKLLTKTFKDVPILGMPFGPQENSIIQAAAAGSGGMAGVSLLHHVFTECDGRELAVRKRVPRVEGKDHVTPLCQHHSPLSVGEMARDGECLVEARAGT
jgi:hypothetical protein